MQKSYQANAQSHRKKWTTENRQKERQHLTAVLQKSGFSGLLNILPRINFCGMLTVLCSEIRFFAKPQTVMPNARTTEQPTTNRQKKLTLDC